jgi:hypothetical protein
LAPAVPTGAGSPVQVPEDGRAALAPAVVNVPPAVVGGQAGVGAVAAPVAAVPVSDGAAAPAPVPAAAEAVPIAVPGGAPALAEAGGVVLAGSGAPVSGGARRVAGVATSQPAVPARPVLAASGGPAAREVAPAEREVAVAAPARQEVSHAPEAAVPVVADVPAVVPSVGAGSVTTAAGGAAATPSVAADHKVVLHEAQADASAGQPAVAAEPVQVAPAAVPAGPAAETPAVTVHAGSPAAPAAQLAPTLLTLAKAMDGSQQMTVRMQPADLGMVQVRIARAVSGGTQIEITAENPATLQALQRDQPQLHRTLDEAGVPAAGRNVTFHVAAAAVPAAAGGAGAGAAGGHSHSQPNSGGRANSATTDADGSAGGGRGSYPARERNSYSTARRPVPAPATGKASAAPAGKSYRIGLDITA